MDKDLLSQYKALDSPNFNQGKTQDKQQLAVAQKQANWLFNFLEPGEK